MLIGLNEGDTNLFASLVLSVTSLLLQVRSESLSDHFMVARDISYMCALMPPARQSFQVIPSQAHCACARTAADRRRVRRGR